MGDVNFENQKIIASDSQNNDTFGRSAAVSNTHIIVGANNVDDLGNGSGAVYSFVFENGKWIQESKILPSVSSEYASFGMDVSIDGNTLIVGAPGHSNQGAAFVFVHNGDSWIQEAILIPSDIGMYDNFGKSVSVSGDLALIASFANDEIATDAGAAYIFRRTKTGWIEEAKLLASDGVSNDRFGEKVCVEGNVAAISTLNASDNYGAVYIFELTDSEWIQTNKISGLDSQYSAFGCSIDIENEKIAIGSYAASNSRGEVYVYSLDGSESTNLTATNLLPDDNFGYSVRFSNNAILVGAFGDDQNGNASGSAYLFRNDKFGWHEESQLLPSDGEDYDYFGQYTGFYGGIAVVTSNSDDDNGSASGSAYVFNISSSTDSDNDGIPNWEDNCEIYNPNQTDCNENGIGDVCDIEFQTSFDCNQNYIPDECESDCDADGIIDDCDNDGDYDGDGIPNNCEADCNENNIPDEFEIKFGMVTDCDLNGIPDECEDFSDCNANGIPDACDILDGLAQDCDENGVPDVCEDPQIELDLKSVLQGHDSTPGDRLGIDVAIHGNTIIAGGQDANNQKTPYAGEAYIYQFSNDEWAEQIKISPPDASQYDYFGASVSIYDDVVIIGSSEDDDYGTQSGSAFVYRRVNSEWQLEAQLSPTDASPWSWFGFDVSIYNDLAIVGSIGGPSSSNISGAAYIFRFNGTDWVQEAKLLPSDGTVSDWFGYSVAINEDTAIVGAAVQNPNWEGAAYVFNLNEGEWQQETKLVPQDHDLDDRFGMSVSLSDNVALIGAYFNNIEGVSAVGSAYIFRKIDEIWIEETQLIASDWEQGDQFGKCVSISGDVAVVGAPDDDVDNLTDAGSWYLFKYSNGIWSEELQMTFDTPNKNDSFGKTLSISNQFAVAGFMKSNNNTGNVLVYSIDYSGDCDLNGLIDLCEINSTPSLDCDENSILDSCSIEDGSSEDCNTNLYPDSCEIIENPTLDQNENNILDECECLSDVSDGSTPGIGDGQVDVNDLLVVIGFWNSQGPIGDINFDGTVNVDDLLIVISNWGPCE